MNLFTVQRGRFRLANEDGDELFQDGDLLSVPADVGVGTEDGPSGRAGEEGVRVCEEITLRVLVMAPKPAVSGWAMIYNPSLDYPEKYPEKCPTRIWSEYDRRTPAVS